MSTDMVPFEENVNAVQVPDKPVLWRREMYLKLGFTQPQAHKLADARDKLGFPVYWGDVADVLEKVQAKGIDEPHLVVFDIFSDGE